MGCAIRTLPEPESKEVSLSTLHASSSSPSSLSRHSYSSSSPAVRRSSTAKSFAFRARFVHDADGRLRALYPGDRVLLDGESLGTITARHVASGYPAVRRGASTAAIVDDPQSQLDAELTGDEAELGLQREDACYDVKVDTHAMAFYQVARVRITLVPPVFRKGTPVYVVEDLTQVASARGNSRRGTVLHRKPTGLFMVTFPDGTVREDVPLQALRYCFEVDARVVVTPLSNAVEENEAALVKAVRDKDFSEFDLRVVRTGEVLHRVRMEHVLPQDSAGQNVAYRPGQRVTARWSNDVFYPATIVKHNADGTYAVEYFDADSLSTIPPSWVRPYFDYVEDTRHPLHEVYCPRPHLSKITSVCFSADGRLLATASGPEPGSAGSQGVVRFWHVSNDAYTFHSELLLPDKHDVATSNIPVRIEVEFSPVDLHLVAIACPSGLVLYDIDSQTSSSNDEFYGELVSFSPCGKVVAVAAGSAAYVCDVDLEATPRILSAVCHSSKIKAIAFSPITYPIEPPGLESNPQQFYMLATSSLGSPVQLWRVDLATLRTRPRDDVLLERGQPVVIEVHDKDNEPDDDLPPPLHVSAPPASARPYVMYGTVRNAYGDNSYRVVFPNTNERCSFPGDSLTRSHTKLFELPHQATVTALVFAIDGTTLYSGTRRGRIRRWSVETGEALTTFSHAHSLAVSKIAVHASGNLASVSLDGYGHLYSLDGLMLRDPFKAPLGSLVTVDWHPTEPVLVTAVCTLEQVPQAPDRIPVHTAVSWNIDAGQFVQVVRAPLPTARLCAFAHDGFVLAVADLKEPGLLSFLATGNNIFPSRSILDVPGVNATWMPDQAHILLVQADGTIQAAEWQHDRTACSVGNIVHVLERPGKVIEFSPLRTRFAVCGPSLCIYSSETYELLLEFDDARTRDCTGVGWLTHNRLATWTTGSMLVHFWDAATGQHIGSHAHQYPLVWSDALRNGEGLVVMGRYTATMLAIKEPDPELGAQVAQCSVLWRTDFGFSAELSNVTVSPNSERVAVTGDDRTVRLLDTKTGELEHLILQHKSRVDQVLWDPHSTQVVSLSYGDSALKVFNVNVPPSLDEIVELLPDPGMRNAVHAIAKRFPRLCLRRAEHEYSVHVPGLSRGDTLTHWAAREGDPEVLYHVIAIEPGAALLASKLYNPLQLAVMQRNDECVSTMLDALSQDTSALLAAENLPALFPLLAREHPALLTKFLQRVPVVPVSDSAADCAFVQDGAETVKGLKSTSVLRLGSESRLPFRLWKNHLGERGGSSRDSGVNVSARIVPIKNLAAYVPRQSTSNHPIGALLHHGLLDAMSAPVVQEVLEFKWQTFARADFTRRAAHYIVWLLLFTLATLQETCYGWDNYFRLAVDAGVLIYLALAMYVEAEAIYHEGFKQYFSAYWSWLDMSAVLLMISLIPARLTCWYYESALQAVVAIRMWLRLLFFARGIQATGRFVRMVIAILASIVSFVAVLLIFFVGFSHAMFLLFRDQDVLEFSGWETMLTLYRMLLSGEFERDLIRDSSVPTLTMIYLILFSAIAGILMLNLMIAVMNSVYERIRSNASAEYSMERARIILQIENTLSRQDTERTDWFPRWVHILTPNPDSHKPPTTT